MLEFLSKFFPCVKKLIEINEVKDKLIENLEKTPKEYVVVKPMDRTSPEFINEIGGLWRNNEMLVWFVHSVSRDIYHNMLKPSSDAEAHKNQLTGIEILINAFEEFEKAYGKIQILPTQET